MTMSLAKCQISQGLYEVATQVKEVITNVVREVCKIREALDKIEQEDSFEAHENPQVSYEIEGLKQSLRELTIYSRGFLSACKSLAKYSSNDRHLQCIKDDLNNGRLERLKRFVKDIISRMAICRMRVDEYQAEYNKLKRHVDNVMTEASRKAEQKAENVRDLHNISRGIGVASGVTGAGASIAAVCSMAGFASLAFPPAAVVSIPIGITSMVIGGILVFTAAGTGGAAIGFSVAKSISEKERKVLKQAADSVLKLQETMHNSKTKVAELEAQLKTISDVIEVSEMSNEGLKHLVEDPERYEDGELESLFDIEEKLDKLQDEMKCILKAIENERV